MIVDLHFSNKKPFVEYRKSWCYVQNKADDKCWFSPVVVCRAFIPNFISTQRKYWFHHVLCFDVLGKKACVDIPCFVMNLLLVLCTVCAQLHCVALNISVA